MSNPHELDAQISDIHKIMCPRPSFDPISDETIASYFKFFQRQDLVHVLLGVVRPSPDTLLIRVELGKDDCDPFVLCVAQKKIATRLSKEMQDLVRL